MVVRRFVRGAATALTLTLLVTFGLARPAQAALWQLSDGFEVTPALTWLCWNSVEDPIWGNECNAGHWSSNPHSGERTGWIHGHSGWTELGRHVSISPLLPGRSLSCAAGFFVRQLSREGDLHGQLEVIDRDTWTYVSVRPFTLSADKDLDIWREVTTDVWVPPSKDVFVRIGIIGEDLPYETDVLEADSMVVSCAY